MLRHLLNIASIVCLVLCVALLGMWVRSYRLRDEANYRYWPNRVLELVSMQGRLQLREGSPFGGLWQRFNSCSIEEWQSSPMIAHTGFDSGSTGYVIELKVPHWTLVLCVGILAAVLALPFPYHTSVRTLPIKFNNAVANNLPRLRFSLRMMSIAVLVCALLLWVGRATIEFWNTKPTVALADAVNQFNARAIEDKVGELEPALTADEVLSSIKSQLATLNSNPESKRMYEQILRTGRMPVGAELYFMDGYNPGNGPTKAVWWINLDVPCHNGLGYGLRIRENNNPVVGQTPP